MFAWIFQDDTYSRYRCENIRVPIYCSHSLAVKLEGKLKIEMSGKTSPNKCLRLCSTVTFLEKPLAPAGTDFLHQAVTWSL